MSFSHEHLHLRYQGRFVFSIFPRGHASWCHLKVIEGPHKTLVIFTKEEDNPGTFIANAAEKLATQVTNLFDLEPASTIFLERTPPVDHDADWRGWVAQETASHDPFLLVLTLSSTSEDTYEQIVFTWSESSDYNQPHYLAHNPAWEVLKPVEMIKYLQEL